ncbi:MAG TPA: hypothetical protein VFU27_11365, partial [Terriglobales bacterium]|nr:hypothetical protein [Terriglobales bacterium]
RRVASQVLFATGGKIIGYAEVGFPRLELRERLGKRGASYAGWEGYIEAVSQATTVSAYAVDGPGSCALITANANPQGAGGEPLRFSIHPAAK